MNPVIKKIALTGATGAIGMALIERCISENVEVIVFVRADSARRSRIPDNEYVTVVACGLDEMRDIEVTAKMQGCEVFYHFAWEGTSGAARNDMYMQNRNVEHTLDAVHLAAKMGCKVFVGAGSQAEYGRVEGVLTPDTPCYPETGYGIAKHCAGRMSAYECMNNDMAHVWARILSVYGPYDNERSMIISVIRKLLAGESPSLTAGEQIWDYLYSADAADMLYELGSNALADKDDPKVSRIYCIGSGRAMPLRQYIEMMRDEIDSGISLGFGDIPYGDRQVMRLEADISDVVRDTGYTPRTGFAEGIRETIKWCRDDR